MTVRDHSCPDPSDALRRAEDATHRACHRLDDEQCWALLLEHDHARVEVAGRPGVTVGYAAVGPGMVALRSPSPLLELGARRGDEAVLELGGAGRHSAWTVLLGGTLRQACPVRDAFLGDVPDRGHVVVLEVSTMGGCESLAQGRLALDAAV
ncbi:hypothetical protein [Nocardioides sp. GY 10127]|uniref:hypothetical protein n=1 Tax=Nocardioides sp. GY 10127 TaxID=2569762 RepID=UPI0010A77C4B|nr:hypothetical protein [Nocardioides sp. GY 10127]TIC82828.1 hypothetical protein E8D37_09155 [Nocardioides sp. GY 10127]